MDANSKLGPALIPGDPCEQSKNGKLLLKVIEENDLIVVNGTDLCKGIITRYRQTKNSIEKSVLDYFLVCRKFYNLIMSLMIDEDRIYALTKYSNKNGKIDVKESDHNGLILKIKSNWNTSVHDKSERVEIYNYKNKDDFQKFQEESEDNEELRIFLMMKQKTLKFLLKGGLPL